MWGCPSCCRARDKRRTLRSFLRQLGSFYRILRRLPVHYKRASLSFAWKVIIKCPDQMPFILPFILMGFHYYMFTFAHMLPELSASIKRLAAERDASAKLTQRPAA